MYVADDDPIGIPRESAEALLGQLDQLCGTEAMAQLTAPSRADDERLAAGSPTAQHRQPEGRSGLRASCWRSTRARFSR
jgi:hypothetical protein